MRVPRATKVIAVMPGSRPHTQPKRPARSPTMTVMIAMKPKLTQKAGQPPPKETGGTRAKETCREIQGRHREV